jgi:putative methionine-R-sulfoxide reductase with GAF domain
MAESLAFSKTADRQKIYDELAPQIAALVDQRNDLVANLANITAALKEAFGFFWVGFYVKKENQLVLSAFQGTIACTRIDFDKGVCGHCYTTKETVIVPMSKHFPDTSPAAQCRNLKSFCRYLINPARLRWFWTWTATVSTIFPKSTRKDCKKL